IDRLPHRTNLSNVAANARTDPAYAPAPDPDTGTAGLSPPPQSPAPAKHPWRCDGTTAGADETRCPDRSADSPPAAPAPAVKLRFLSLSAVSRTRTDPVATAAIVRIPAAVAIRPRSLQLHLAELHLHAVDGVGGKRPVLRKQTQRRIPLLPLIKHLQRLAPCRLLAVVDFAQVQNLPLRYFSRLQTPTFHHRVVAVLLSVFDPRIAAQKHACLQNARFLPGCIERRSPLQTLSKMFYSAR